MRKKNCLHHLFNYLLLDDHISSFLNLKIIDRIKENRLNQVNHSVGLYNNRWFIFTYCHLCFVVKKNKDILYVVFFSFFLLFSFMHITKSCFSLSYTFLLPLYVIHTRSYLIFTLKINSQWKKTSTNKNAQRNLQFEEKFFEV
jgi:hypothetical protein